MFNLKLTRQIFLGLVFVDLVSLFAYLYAPLNIAGFVFLVVSFLIVCLYDFRLGFAALLLEFFANSFGRLFFIDSELFVPLRIAMFVVFMSVFLYREAGYFLQDKKRFWIFWLSFLRNKIFGFITLFIIIVFLGFLKGILANDFAKVFLDFNNYLALLYIFPFYKIMSDTDKKHWQIYFSAIVAGGVFIVYKTYFALWIFSHNIYGILLPFYKWIRDFGFGEITLISGSFYRVFMQNQIYVVVLFFVFISYLWHRYSQDGLSVIKDKKIVSVIFVLGMFLSVIFISLSRSFWLGFVLASVLFGVYVWRKGGIISAIKFAGLSAVSAVVAVLLVLAVLYIPPAKQRVSLSGAVEGRVSVYEPAGSSRLNLLSPLWREVKKNIIFGAGFGKTVTYRSADPRVVLSTAGMSGEYTTFAFEWTYLDIWLKVGLIGLVVYLYILYLIFKQFYLNIKERGGWLNVGALFSLVAFTLINITTPYLNHPLGIVYLLVIISYLDFYN